MASDWYCKHETLVSGGNRCADCDEEAEAAREAEAPAPHEAGAILTTAAWRDLGYEGPLSQEEVVAALDRLGGHSPEGAAIEITVRALRAEVERLRKVLRKAYTIGRDVYVAVWREGWEPGKTKNEAFDALHSWLCENGGDPNAALKWEERNRGK